MKQQRQRTSNSVDQLNEKHSAEPHTENKGISTDHSPANQQTVRALGLDDSNTPETKKWPTTVPPLPQPLTENSARDWLQDVTEKMNPNSKYRKDLIGVIQRYDFRKKRTKG